MPRKLYLINLNTEDHQTLDDMTHKGRIKARQMKRAMILLKANDGSSDPQIMATLNVSRPCVVRIRKRFVQISERHTKIDFAQEMKWLLDVFYPQASLILIVMDNLRPHKPASLYEAFPPAEARWILKKLELHFTPKHGNWLNMAEIELSVFSKRLKLHIPDPIFLEREVQAITPDRNCT